MDVDMDFDKLIAVLGEPIEDPDEEAFLLFSQPIPSHNLGFVDPKAEVIQVSIGERDYEIRQSPGVLQSNREGGTTGAVLWSVTPLLATWLTTTHTILHKLNILGPTTTAVELGTGTSALLALSLAPTIAHYIATDQSYALKLLRQNLADNAHIAAAAAAASSLPAASKTKPGSRKPTAYRPSKARNPHTTVPQLKNVTVAQLDWQTDSALSLRTHLPATPQPSIDVLFACDCVYNEALVAPFVATCAEICAEYQGGEGRPVVCVVAQQVRAHEVFEAWVRACMRRFVVWRVGDGELCEGLKGGSGFVVHVGVLRERLVEVSGRG